jgi:hypothetical protein
VGVDSNRRNHPKPKLHYYFQKFPKTQLKSERKFTPHQTNSKTFESVRPGDDDDKQIKNNCGLKNKHQENYKKEKLKERGGSIKVDREVRIRIILYGVHLRNSVRQAGGNKEIEVKKKEKNRTEKKRKRKGT